MNTGRDCIHVLGESATATLQAVSAKACLFVLSFLLAGECRTAAFAEDWPAWRKDGSGVSTETGLPQQWGPEENVRWKTAIPGEGVSSPIVWKDRVFVTAVVPGTVRHVLYHIHVVLLWTLTLAALWWYVDGTPDDPLGQQRFRSWRGTSSRHDGP